MTTVRRTTTETDVTVELAIAQGQPTTTVDTTDAFLDHLLVTFARYGGLDLTLRATGDLDHHLREDVAITLGRAIAEVTPAACARYGTATIPMDDALVTASVDLGGRPYWGGSLPDPDDDHLLRSLAVSAGATLHVVVVRGHDHHHVVEAAHKALGAAVRQALAHADQVFSTKGSVTWEVS